MMMMGGGGMAAMPMQGGMVMSGGMAPAGGYGGYACGGHVESDVFVEVTPVLEPNFARGPNGTFFLQVPPIIVNLCTSCNPPPPLSPGLHPFKPQEQFMVQFPDLQQVVFNPATRQPPNATVQSFTMKRGAVLEVPAQVGLNAQLKANSPHGALVLEDIQVCPNGMKQKVGENTLHWKLQLEGQLSMSQGAGNGGAHRLEVELKFVFVAQLSSGASGLAHGGGMQGGMMMAQQPQMMMAQPQGGMMMVSPHGGCGGCGGGVVMMQQPCMGQAMF